MKLFSSLCLLLALHYASGSKRVFHVDFTLSDATKQALGYAEDTLLNFTQLAGKHGYNVTEHTVTTEDGYISTLFRMWSGNCTTFGTPVLMMHGVLLTADAFITAGKDASLGYLLADNCHDVWVGNYRGNYYARAHTTLDPDGDADFWNHSPDEMAAYDLPAIIDTVLQTTGYSTLNYIGYSQGAGTILMMCAESEEQCAKVNLIVAMAAGTRTLNARSTAARLLFNLYVYLESALTTLEIFEVQYRGSLVQVLLEYACQQEGRSELLFGLCQTFLYTLDSDNVGSIANETFPLIYSKFPGGVSLHTAMRWAQCFEMTEIQKFDFGSDEENMAAYNSTTPPVYDLSRVTAPVVFLQGPDDRLVNPRDTLWAAAQLPNLLAVHMIEDSGWNHIDFLYSQNIPTLVLPTVLQYLEQYTTYN